MKTHFRKFTQHRKTAAAQWKGSLFQLSEAISSSFYLVPSKLFQTHPFRISGEWIGAQNLKVREPDRTSVWKSFLKQMCCYYTLFIFILTWHSGGSVSRIIQMYFNSIQIILGKERALQKKKKRWRKLIIRTHSWKWNTTHANSRSTTSKVPATTLMTDSTGVFACACWCFVWYVVKSMGLFFVFASIVSLCKSLNSEALWPFPVFIATVIKGIKGHIRMQTGSVMILSLANFSSIGFHTTFSELGTLKICHTIKILSTKCEIANTLNSHALYWSFFDRQRNSPERHHLCILDKVSLLNLWLQYGSWSW